MKIYIDAEFKCHTINDGTMIEVETGFFNGKCQVFVEGYRFIPSGESLIYEDGKVLRGEMIIPWKPYGELDAAQREYEQQKIINYENEKNELIASYTNGVNSV